jgi:uncharacterized protein Usg
MLYHIHGRIWKLNKSVKVDIHKEVQSAEAIMNDILKWGKRIIIVSFQLESHIYIYIWQNSAYTTDWPTEESWFNFWQRPKDFCPLPGIQTVSVAHPASYSTCIMGFFSHIKQLKCEADHSPPHGAFIHSKIRHLTFNKETSILVETVYCLDTQKKEMLFPLFYRDIFKDHSSLSTWTILWDSIHNNCYSCLPWVWLHEFKLAHCSWH